ncbi:MAG: transposase [Fibrobacterota bacterium]
MRLNNVGKSANDCWHEIPVHFPHVALDCFVAMPNHVHGIIRIVDLGNRSGGTFGKPVIGSIPAIIRSFKSAVSKRFHDIPGFENTKLWQRNYWEHIIRNEESLYTIRHYIRNNPEKWQNDCFIGNGNELHEEQAVYFCRGTACRAPTILTEWMDVQ